MYASMLKLYNPDSKGGNIKTIFCIYYTINGVGMGIVSKTLPVH